MAKQIIRKIAQPDIIKKNAKNIKVSVFSLAIVYILLFDSNSMLKRFTNYLEINELKNEIKSYRDDIEISKRRAHELKSDKADLEKFAREQFLMKKKNEDIYIIK